MMELPRRHATPFKGKPVRTHWQASVNNSTKQTKPAQCACDSDIISDVTVYRDAVDVACALTCALGLGLGRLVVVSAHAGAAPAAAGPPRLRHLPTSRVLPTGNDIRRA